MTQAHEARDGALHVLHVDTERVWRGGQAQIAILMDALARLGHVSTLAAPEGPLAARARAAGHAHVPFAPRSDLDLFAAFTLGSWAKHARPDVVHLHSGRAHATGFLASRSARAPAIVTRRVLFDDARGGTPRLSLKWRLPLARVIAISHAIESALLRAGVPAGRLVVVPDALDVAAFERAVGEARSSGGATALRAAWGVPEGAPLLGMLAAFTPEKDHATLVDAAARVLQTRPEAHFVALGEGPRLESVRRTVEARGLGARVHLPGRAPDVATAIAALDAFALFTRAEGLGSSILLAQAARIPVVATRVGGVPDLIEDGVSGRLVDSDDVAAAARAIEEALTRGPRVLARVAEAHQRLGAFDAPRSAERHERIYREALAARGTPWRSSR